MAQLLLLHCLLPKPVSQAQSEFTLKPTTRCNFCHRDTSLKSPETSDVSHPVQLSRRSLGQKRCQERETLENNKPAAQKFRRQIEDAEQWLDIAPDCDSTQALSKILDHNFIQTS
ncbi:hypothetical protein B0H10DRAFT_1976359 [Mycena sp. CBHHK59/15]|nr:hypothetical protein B0H10DRAFT_1976359 [Mycena sp. CBHHK59/15]